MTQSLPTLNYNLIWSDYSDRKRNQTYEKVVRNFIDEVDMVRVIRDGLGEVAELGMVVTCLRAKKYVQFLDVDELRINKQKNGKWVVEYDLKNLDSIKDHQTLIETINSLPPEVSVSKYTKYKKSKNEKDRYVEIKNCHVVNINAKRNSPIGLPLTLGAWLPILQKEIINRVERSVADRLIKQVILLYASYIDKDQSKPVPKQLLDAYFKQITGVLQKKEGGHHRASSDSAGLATIALPHFLKLDSLNVDTTMFKKELYEKIDQDIYINLGVSPSLLAGLEGNYASANVNNEKFYSFIMTIVEQFEKVFNDYLKIILPKDVDCKLVFDRSTILDKKYEIDKYKEFYLQTGVIQPWIESIFGGGTFKAILEQAKYEQETLEVYKHLKPPLNAYTSSSKDKIREENKPENPNTEKTKTNDGNNTPSPSD